jgi:hypothetical protein
VVEKHESSQHALKIAVPGKRIILCELPLMVGAKMISQPELEATVKKAVLLYNRLKSPEAFTKVIAISPMIVTISFSGTFCVNCSVPLDYIKDFISGFKIFNKKVELTVGTTRLTNKDTLEVDYRAKSN